jgi:hypothetical protein
VSETPIIASNGEEPTSITADGNLNYTWQWRDRFGRWVEMGRGIKFKVRLKNNTTASVIGDFVGSGDEQGVGYIHVKGDPNLPDGFYKVKSGNAQEVLTSLDPEYLAKRGIELGKAADGTTITERADADIDSVDTIVRLDAPPGWKKNRDGSYVTEDGVYQMTQNSDGTWRVTRANAVVVQEPTPDETRAEGDKAAKAQGKPGLMAQEQELIGDFSKESEGFRAVSDLRLEGRLSPEAKRQVDDLRKQLGEKKDRIAILTDPEGVRGQRVQKNIDDLNDQIQAILRPTVNEPPAEKAETPQLSPKDKESRISELRKNIASSTAKLGKPEPGTPIGGWNPDFIQRGIDQMRKELAELTGNPDDAKSPSLKDYIYNTPEPPLTRDEINAGREPNLNVPPPAVARRLFEETPKSEKPLSEQVKERTQPQESTNKTLSDVDPEFLAGFISKLDAFKDNPNAWGAIQPFDPDKAQIFSVEDAKGVQSVWWTPDGVSLWNYDESTGMIFQQTPKEEGKSAEDLFMDKGWRANAVRKGKNLVFLTKEDSDKALGLNQGEGSPQDLVDQINEAIAERNNLRDQLDAESNPDKAKQIQEDLNKAESNVSDIANLMDNWRGGQKPEPSAVEESKGATEKSGFGEDYDFINSPEYLDAVEKFKQDALARAEGMKPIERRKAAREARKLNREQDIQAKRDRAAQNNVDREQQLLDFAKSKTEYEVFKEASRLDNLFPEQYEAGDWMSDGQLDFWLNATPGTKVEVDFDLNDPSIDGEQSGTLTRGEDGLWYVDAGDLEANFENRYGKLAFTTDELQDLMAPYGNEEGLHLAPGQVITPSGPPPQSEKKTIDISPSKIHGEIANINRQIVELDQKQLAGEISAEDANKERVKLQFFREVLRQMDEQAGGFQFKTDDRATVIPDAEKQDILDRIDAEIARLKKNYNPSVNDLTDITGQMIGELEGDRAMIVAGNQIDKDNLAALRALPTPEQTKENEEFIFSLADRGVIVPEDEKRNILDRLDGEINRLEAALNEEPDVSFTGNPAEAMAGRLLDLKTNRQLIADGKKVDARFLEEARNFKLDTLRQRDMTPENVAESVAQNPDSAVEIDINGDINAQIEAAIADGKMVKFMYFNKADGVDKLRIVKPQGIWTNNKNGKVHLRAVDSDGVSKNFELIEMKAVPAANESDVPTPMDTTDPETTEVPDSEAQVSRIIRMLDILEQRNQIVIDAVLNGEWDTEEAEQILSANEEVQKTLLAELDQLNAGDKEKMVSQVKQMIKLVEDRMANIEDELTAGNFKFDDANALYISNGRMLDNLNEQLAKLGGAPEGTAKPKTLAPPAPNTMDAYNQQLEDIRRRRDELEQAARAGEIPLVRAQGIRNGLDAEERQIREARNRGAGMEANRGDLFRAPAGADQNDASSRTGGILQAVKDKLNAIRDAYRAKFSGEFSGEYGYGAELPPGFIPFPGWDEQGAQAIAGKVDVDEQQPLFGKLYDPFYGQPNAGHDFGDGIVKEQVVPIMARLLGIEEARLVAHISEVGDDFLLGEFAVGDRAGDVRPGGMYGGDAKAKDVREYKNADLLGLLDVITVNQDRHGYNYFVGPDNVPIPIDHGGVAMRKIEDIGDDIGWRDEFWKAIFQVQDNGGKPKFYNPVFSRQELVPLRENLESARAIFRELGAEEYLDNVLHNFDQIIAAAQDAQPLDLEAAKNLKFEDNFRITDPQTGNRIRYRVLGVDADGRVTAYNQNDGFNTSFSSEQLEKLIREGRIDRFVPPGAAPEAVSAPKSETVPPAESGQGIVPIPEMDSEFRARLESLREKLANPVNLAEARDRETGGEIAVAPYGDGTEYTRNGVIHGRIVPDTMIPQFRPGYKAVYKPGAVDEAHAYFDNKEDAQRWLGTVIGMIEDLPENPINREMIDFDFLRNVREYQGIELQTVGDYEANLVDVLMEGKQVPEELRKNIKNLFLAGDVNIGQGRDIIDLLNDLPNRANTGTKPRKSTNPTTNAAPELIVGPEDDPDKIKDPNLIMQDVRRNHPDFVVLKNGDVVVSSREVNGKRYEVVVRRTQQERFFAYIRETDIASGAVSVVKMGSETHSYKALISQLNKAKGAIQSNDVPRHLREHYKKRFTRIPDNADMSGFEPLGDVIQDFIAGANLPENKREIAALARDLLSAGFDRLFQIDPEVLEHVLKFARENDLSPEFINGLMDNIRLNKVREAGILNLRNVIDNPTHQDANGVELKEGDIVDWPQWDPNEPGYGRVFRGRVQRIKYAQVGGGGNVDYVYSDYLVVISEEYNRFRGDKKPKSRQRDRVAANLVKVNEGDPITPFFEPKVKEAREQEDILIPEKMGIPANPPAGEAPRTIKRPTTERPNSRPATFVTDPNGNDFVESGMDDTDPVMLAIADQAELDRIAAPLKAQQPENVNEYQPGDLLPVWDNDQNRMRYDQILAVEVQPDGSVKITKLILKPWSQDNIIRDVILHPNQLMPLLRPPVQDRFSGGSGENIAKTPEGYSFFDNGEEKLYLPEYATMNTIGKVSGRWEIVPDENGKYVGEIMDEDGRVIMSNRYGSPSLARDAIAIEIRLRNQRRRAEDEAAKNKDLIAPEGYVLQENSGEAFLVPEDKNGVQSKKYIMRWDKGTGGVPANLQIQDRNGNTVGWAEAFSVEEAQDIINEWLNDSRNVLTPEPVAPATPEVAAPNIALNDLIGADNQSRQEWLDNAPVGALVELKINNSVFTFMKRPSGRWSTYLDGVKEFGASNLTYKADYLASRGNLRYAGQVPSDFNLGSVNAAQDLNNGQSIPDLNWMKNAPVGAVIFNTQLGDKFVKLNDGSWAVLEFNASGPHHDGVVPEDIWDFYGKDLVFAGAAPEGYDLGRNDKAPSVKTAPKFVPSIFNNPDAPWRNQPATQKQKDRLRQLLKDKKVAPSLHSRIFAALGDPNVTKGQLSDFINQLNDAQDLTRKVPTLDMIFVDMQKAADDVVDNGNVDAPEADDVANVSAQSKKLATDPNIDDNPPTDIWGGENVRHIKYEDVIINGRNAPFVNMRGPIDMRADGQVGDIVPYGRGEGRIYYQLIGFDELGRPRFRIIAGEHNWPWQKRDDGKIVGWANVPWAIRNNAKNVRRVSANPPKDYINPAANLDIKAGVRAPAVPRGAGQVGGPWAFNQDEKDNVQGIPNDFPEEFKARAEALKEAHLKGIPKIQWKARNGIMNQGAFGVVGENGLKYFVKRVSRAEYYREVLVNRIALTLGITDIVLIGGGDGRTVIMELAPGKDADSTPGWRDIEYGDRFFEHKNARLMGLMDYIVNNTDRHEQNWHIDPVDFHPVPIDAGHCWFDEHNETNNHFRGKVLADADGNKELFTKSELYALRDKLKALQNVFEDMNQLGKYNYMIRKIDELIARYGY